ncbi:hypothetical protein HYQ45_008657 [Verticillium longisporum]|uniref:Uncharacterized protein n=1 Tax=Verticillium longisporum TaxID=100787 RepID=A0A8I2ZLR6_VERLO|nr:hypothetical protein HYQ44_010685 [Verticillium longisporum]KAG7133120.1 hypothetical protein HYQ45_008657 [Verticillium longisporum]KAG7152237.1 hypothetical protein HYQ46_011934 [Verticillium longisporum]
MSLRIARAVTARAPLVARAPLAASFHSSAAKRKVVNTGDAKDDLGGPGGQDPPPRKATILQDWPSIAAMGAVAVVVGGGVVYFTSNPRKAEKVRQKTIDTQVLIGEKAEEAKGYVKDKAKDVEAEAKKFTR